MAIFSLNISKVSKSNGSSAVAASAYQHRERYRAEATKTLYDYRYKASEEAAVDSFMLLPSQAPREYQDPLKLWNAVEKIEKRSDALLARRVIVALPKELTRDQNKELLQDYCQRTFVDNGMCVDASIHWKDGNPHAHLLLTTRPIKENGEWGAKEKSVFKLDENGEKIPQLNPDGTQKVRIRKGKGTEKLWEREKVDVFKVNHTNIAEEWRAAWAECCNSRLAADRQIDHRSYERQGVDIVPQIHVGYSPRRREINEEIKNLRKSINTLIEKIKSLKTEISALSWITVPKKWVSVFESRIYKGNLVCNVHLPQYVYAMIPPELQRDADDYMRDIGNSTLVADRWQENAQSYELHLQDATNKYREAAKDDVLIMYRDGAKDDFLPRSIVNDAITQYLEIEKVNAAEKEKTEQRRQPLRRTRQREDGWDR